MNKQECIKANINTNSLLVPNTGTFIKNHALNS